MFCILKLIEHRRHTQDASVKDLFGKLVRKCPNQRIRVRAAPIKCVSICPYQRIKQSQNAIYLADHLPQSGPSCARACPCPCRPTSSQWAASRTGARCHLCEQAQQQLQLPSLTRAGHLQDGEGRPLLAPLPMQTGAVSACYTGLHCMLGSKN